MAIRSAQAVLIASLLTALPAVADPLEALTLGSVWRITSIASATLPDEVVVTLERPEPGMIGGMAACNSYFGLINLEGETALFGPLANTKMACAPNLMLIEMLFHATMAWVDEIRGDADMLELLSGGSVVMTALR
jgi:putative lipoprotein